MQNTVKFYEVLPSYADYLRLNFDSKVPNITYSKRNKFVCGIVFQFKDIPYYAPISSELQKYRTTFPIFDKHGEQKSTIKLCFMFPAPISALKQMDFRAISTEDTKYADLLLTEYDYCRRHIDSIRDKAEKIYRIGCDKSHFLNKNCCDFKLLERGYLQYNEYVLNSSHLQAEKQAAPTIEPDR